MSKIGALWREIVEWFESIGDDVLGLMKPLARQIVRSGGALLVEAARDAVRAAEQQGGSGKDKFAAAQSAVIAKLESQGVEIIINAINGAIELAVAELKD